MDSASLIKEIIQAIADGRPLLIASDVDGTLTRYSSNRSDVDLVPGILDAFETLAACGVPIVIASARRLADIVEAFASVPNANFVANDGCRTKINGIVVDYKKIEDFTEVAAAAQAFAKGLTGVTPTDMGHFYGIVVEADNPHFKAAGELLKTFVRPGLTTKEHPMGHTLEPIDKPGKETALQKIIASLGLADPYVVYTGDGNNDIGAQRWVKQNRGAAIKILSEPGTSSFDYVNLCLVRTDACAEFYVDLAKAVQAPKI